MLPQPCRSLPYSRVRRTKYMILGIIVHSCLKLDKSVVYYFHSVRS
uniref:Uncharacterized protein n=1 Tax=Arundo donax TaxID=35708 RepID=A0A0A9DIW7_ARUDO